jgi:hypothetical protein
MDNFLQHEDMSVKIIEEYYEHDAAGISGELEKYIGAYGSKAWEQFWTFVKETISGRGYGEVISFVHL